MDDVTHADRIRERELQAREHASERGLGCEADDDGDDSRRGEDRGACRASAREGQQHGADSEEPHHDDDEAAQDLRLGLDAGGAPLGGLGHALVDGGRDSVGEAGEHPRHQDDDDDDEHVVDEVEPAGPDLPDFRAPVAEAEPCADDGREGFDTARGCFDHGFRVVAGARDHAQQGDDDEAGDDAERQADADRDDHSKGVEGDFHRRFDLVGGGVLVGWHLSDQSMPEGWVK